MAKSLMKSLRTEITADLPAVAALLQSKGRGKDTILAHITPQEAALLKKRGGRGSRNPDTNLLEFDDGETLLSPAPGFQAESPSPDTTSTTGFQPETSAVPSTGGTQYDTQASYMAAPAYSQAPAAPAYSQAPTAPAEIQAVSGYPDLSAGGQGYYGGVATPDAAPTAYGLQAPSPQVAATQLAPETSFPGLQAAPATTPTAPTATKPQKGFLESLGLSTGQALGGAALGGLGLLQANKAAQQGQQAKQELLAQAAPYQTQGANMVAAAQSGQLSPASAQAYQAAQARAAQATQASGGGVGAVQSQVALEQFRQQLLNSDLNIGLQIQSIGDKIAQGAIQAGVQADQYVNTLTGNYASNIARVLMGVSPGTTSNATTTTVTG